MNPMPVLFISHGSPLSLLDAGTAAAYRQWSTALPTPRSIIIISAHWETPELRCGETSTHRELIYDFHGFPDRLYEQQYPAPGAPDLINTIKNVLPEQTTLPVEQRGMDHGVWVPLSMLWPQADIPVLQLSLPRTYSNADLMSLGRRLADLRRQQVLLIASGGITHNLRSAFLAEYNTPPEWVTAFEQWTMDSLQHDRARLVTWEQDAPHAIENHPTPEHFRPLLVAAGATYHDDTVNFPVRGYELSVLSTLSVQFG